MLYFGLHFFYEKFKIMNTKITYSPFISGIQAAAEYLGVSRVTLCRMKRNGMLKGTYFQGHKGGVILFSKEKLDHLNELIIK